HRQRIERHSVFDKRDWLLWQELTYSTGCLRVIFFADPHDGERLAPVALAAEQPVAQLVVYRGLADLLLLQLCNDGLLAFVTAHAVEAAGVDHLADICEWQRNVIPLCVFLVDNADDREVELDGEFVVALIMRGNSHN